MSDKEGGGDENHPDNKKLTGEGWTTLRERPRGCTDCLCVVRERNFITLSPFMKDDVIVYSF